MVLHNAWAEAWEPHRLELALHSTSRPGFPCICALQDNMAWRLLPTPDAMHWHNRKPTHATLLCSPRSVAVTFRAKETVVYALHGSDALGPRLFAVPYLESVSFSDGGLFMAGIVSKFQKEDIEVYNGRTGAFLYSILAPQLWLYRCRQVRSSVTACSVAWAGSNKDRLHITLSCEEKADAYDLPRFIRWDEEDVGAPEGNAVWFGIIRF